jgi:P-type Cu+ transporter
MVTDSVCGMSIDEEEARASLRYGERVYYFCSASCRAEFERHPEDYAGRKDDEGEGREDV